MEKIKHWTRIEFIRDTYLFECQYSFGQYKPSIRGFIKFVRRHIVFMKEQFGGIRIICKHGHYDFFK